MKLHHLTALFALNLAFLAGPALATGNHQCQTGYTGTYPNCKPPVVTPPTPQPPTTTNNNANDQSQNQGQAQGQAQGQGQHQAATGTGTGYGGEGGQGGQGGEGGRGGNAAANLTGSGNSRNDLASTSGAASDATAYSGANAASGSTSGSDNAIAVDNRNLSNTRVSSNYLGSVVPMSQPVINGTGNLMVRDSMVCGPLMSIERNDLEGISRGGRGRFKQGLNERISFGPYIDPQTGMIRTELLVNGRRVGHRQVTYAGIVNTGTSRGFSIGGFGNNGGGQMGASGATGVQQIQKLIDLEFCYLDEPRVEIVQAPPEIRYVPRPAPKRKPAAKRKPAPTGCSTVTTCPAK